MFTGIVKEIGKIERVEKKSGLWKLGIKSYVVYRDAEVSDSVSVDGVCLTVVKKKNNLFFLRQLNLQLNLLL